jgi:hypothetical protein
MKTKVFIFFVLVTGMNLFATGKTEKNYVITKSDTIYCKELTFDSFNANCTLLNGEKIKVSKEEVNVYAIKGKIFIKKPLYTGKEPSGKTDFMQVVAENNGYTLYKYEYFPDSWMQTNQAPADQGSRQSVYIVYKGDELVTYIDSKNKSNLFKFFKI